MLIKKLMRFTLSPSTTYSFSLDSTNLNRKEKQDIIVKKLRTNLNPTYLEVVDTTLGNNSCGLMYKILVESPMFIGKTKVQQHQMVAESLQKQLNFIHGYNLKTKETQLTPPLQVKPQNIQKK